MTNAMSAPIDQAVRIVRKALDTAPGDLDTFLTDECEGDADECGAQGAGPIAACNAARDLIHAGPDKGGQP